VSERDSEFWTKARRARDELSDRFLNHPDVSNIDIGLAPGRGDELKGPVLRIHVTGRWMDAKPGERVAFPKEVGGIPVIVMLGEYWLEPDAQEYDED
jgi:hypothetical protein